MEDQTFTDAMNIYGGYSFVIGGSSLTASTAGHLRDIFVLPSINYVRESAYLSIARRIYKMGGEDGDEDIEGGYGEDGGGDGEDIEGGYDTDGGNDSEASTENVTLVME
jgi:hypothetical protein